MFLFLSIFAASFDGFVCGVLAAGMGSKTSYKEIFKATGIIFTCCITASLAGSLLPINQSNLYLNLTGSLMMIYLAVSALLKIPEKYEHSNIYIIALSVAADASMVCLYLAITGYNLIVISLLSAILHGIMLATGISFTSKISRYCCTKHAQYIAAVIFIAMAIYKLTDI
ncbi:MAG: manganese efflux pump [Oscillospiraceae bacterium]|nr:manganese efflux pump [Oscillospiraceae bacterium]